MIRSASPQTYPRPLSERESEILRFVLDIDDDRLTPLRQQASSAVVTGMCKCGCATIDLAVDRERQRPVALCSPVVETTTRVIEGQLAGEGDVFGLLVFLEEGWLSRLEIWWIDQPPEDFPAPSAFDPPRVLC